MAELVAGIHSTAGDRTYGEILEILLRLQSMGFCQDIEISPKNVAFVFDRILSIFLVEICPRSSEARPLPVLLGDGRVVELLALFRAVQGRGGLISVTDRRAWSVVAEESGLGADAGSPVKLIYLKYLEPLERWLKLVFDKAAKADECGSGSKGKNVDVSPGMVSKKEQFLSPVKGSIQKSAVVEDGFIFCNDDDDDEKGNAVRPSNISKGNGKSNSSKRKRENLAGMLNWIRRLAKNPCDPFIGNVLAHVTKGRAHAFRMLYEQVLLSRDATYCMDITDDSLEQKRLKMISSLNDDFVANYCESNKIGRCDRSLQAAGKQSHSIMELSQVPNDDLDNSLEASRGKTNEGNKRLCKSHNLLMNIIAGTLCKSQTQNEVSLGASSQAEIPEWTGMPAETCKISDSMKWLGTKVWPLGNKDSQESLQLKAIGKGREARCSCERPHSIECVRFHVVEEKLRLKRELGSAFYSWKFDHMGEEIALSWTEEEEQRFKTIICSSPSSPNSRLWAELHSSFSSKDKRKLVSYYLNVFLLRRRSYQNRMTPKEIDSDEEETEFSFLSTSMGHERIRSSNHKFCAQNKQSNDLVISPSLDKYNGRKCSRNS